MSHADQYTEEEIIRDRATCWELQADYGNAPVDLLNPKAGLPIPGTIKSEPELVTLVTAMMPNSGRACGDGSNGSWHRLCGRVANTRRGGRSVLITGS